MAPRAALRLLRQKQKARFAPWSEYINRGPFGTVGQLDNFLGDLAVFDVVSILLLDGLHLVLEPQFQLLQSDFFQLFVVGKIPLVSKRGEPLFILRMLLGQFAELLVRGQEMVFRG